MEKTPLSMRKHIAVLGSTNAGKSTLFNKLLGRDDAIVSDVSGTTTDPVIKAMELIPYGPVALIDTAGLGDTTELGSVRTDKTMKVLNRADLILYVRDINCDNRTDKTNINKNKVVSTVDAVTQPPRYTFFGSQLLTRRFLALTWRMLNKMVPMVNRKYDYKN